MGNGKDIMAEMIHNEMLDGSVANMKKTTTIKIDINSDFLLKEILSRFDNDSFSSFAGSRLQELAMEMFTELGQQNPDVALAVADSAFKKTQDYYAENGGTIKGTSEYHIRLQFIKEAKEKEGAK